MKKYITGLILTFLFASMLYSQEKTDANIIGHVVSDDEHIPLQL
jgi:hypothetical protein